METALRPELLPHAIILLPPEVRFYRTNSSRPGFCSSSNGVPQKIGLHGHQRREDGIFCVTNPPVISTASVTFFRTAVPGKFRGALPSGQRPFDVQCGLILRGWKGNALSFWFISFGRSRGTERSDKTLFFLAPRLQTYIYSGGRTGGHYRQVRPC